MRIAMEPDERLASCGAVPPCTADRLRCLQLVQERAREQILVIGQYLTQLLTRLEPYYSAPLMTGETGEPSAQRAVRPIAFGRGQGAVIMARGDLAVELADASVAIQVSGSVRGRKRRSGWAGCLRPKANGARRRSSIRWSHKTPSSRHPARREPFLVDNACIYSHGDSER